MASRLKIFGRHAPRKRGIQYSSAVRNNPICHGVLDRPLSRAMTAVKNSVMVPRHDKSAFLHPRSRRLHSHRGLERALGPELAARPPHHLPPSAPHPPPPRPLHSPPPAPSRA